MPSLPYKEPSITHLLTLSTFLLALNTIDAVLDRTLYCGLVGQVLIGVAWGAPGAAWLDHEIQTTIVQLGYLGLVLVVFEGGAATPVSAIRKNISLSAAVALTGVAAPVALTFALLRGPFADAELTQCFAAAAALCSTSLGTTFAVLGASGLAETRLGCVLGAAAMMDDVVGLVMVQIVARLGGGDIDVADVVVRPVLVSVGFAGLVPLGCWFLLMPLLGLVERSRTVTTKIGEGVERSWLRRLGFLDATHIAFVAQTALLLALVTGASYAGASVLLAAYLAGIVVSWWRDLQQHGIEAATKNKSPDNPPSTVPSRGIRGDNSNEESTTAVQSLEHNKNNDHQTTTHPEEQQPQQSGHSDSDTYEIFYSQAVKRILKPFFFASIGFSIPTSDMFEGDVVWRGIIYSILMALGKMLCGLWLVRFPVSISGLFGGFGSFVSLRYHALFSRFRRPRTSKLSPGNGATELVQQPESSTTTPRAAERDRVAPTNPETRETAQEEVQQQPPSRSQNNDTQPSASASPAKPLSLYPAAIMSSAMVARGEIGFLISAVAESNGVFRRPTDNDGTASGLFLIVTWAIVLCTVIGPVTVGLLVRRVKKLEGRAAAAGSAADRGTRGDVLGVWGVHGREVKA